VHLSRLTLTDFRSYDNAEVAFEPGVTTFVGLNGQGKTNLVEAVGFLANQTSHRVAKDLPLIRAECPQALLAARIRWLDRELALELEINARGANRARVAGAPRRPREALGVLRTVLFAPEDLALVKGDPSARRKFCDELLVARTPRLAGVLTELDRVVRQRSALLRSAAGARRRGATVELLSESLAVWNEQLADVGSDLAVARLQLVADLRQPVVRAYESVAPGAGPADLDYQASWWPESGTPPADRDLTRAALLASMADRQREEMDRGITLVGPQRDDLQLTLGALPAKGYASHGESWSIALALRLASFELLGNALDSGGDPVLILDDVFAELDRTRRRRLAELVLPAEQVLVTAAVASDVPTELRGRSMTVSRDGVSRVS
jgi:DNA replication and repair protein RecF